MQRSEDNLCKLILFFNHVGAQESNSVVLVAGTFTYEPAIVLAQLSFLIVNNAFGNRIYFNFNKVQFLFSFWGSCLSVFYLFGFDCYITFVVCVWMCVLCAVLSAMAHLWKAENKFHQMGPGDQTWVLRLLNGCLYPLSHDQPTSWWENWNEPIIKSKDIKLQPYVFFQ